MAGWKLWKFRELDEITFFLNGAVLGADLSGNGQAIASGGGGTRDIASLAGKTFKTKAPGPVGTVTFVAGTDPGGRLLPKEIKSQIEAAIATIKVYFLSGRIVIQEATPSAGTVIDKTGTANTILGFDTAADSPGKVYGSPYVSPPVVPYFGWSYSVNDNMHVVYTFE